MTENIQEIAPDLYRVSIPLSFGLDYVHTYLAIDQKEVVLFDTGPSFSSCFSIYRQALAHLGKSVEDITRIYITHSHVDHCGIAGRLQEISGAQVFLSRIEYDTLSRARLQHQNPDSRGHFWREYGLGERAVKTFSTVLDAFTSATAPFHTDQFLFDEELIRIGPKSFRVLFTPGHTRGHVCFYLAEEEILLSGDCILPHITPNLSPDLSCPSFLPLGQFLRSLERITALAVRRVYPAHGEPFEDLKERVEEIREHHVQRKGLTFQSLSNTPQLVSDISKKIFGDSLSGFDQGLAFNETYVHLIQLEDEGKVKRIQTGSQTGFVQN